MDTSSVPGLKNREQKSHASSHQHYSSKPNQVGTVLLYGIPIVSLVIDAQERLCLAQISNTLLKQFSYNEIHNRRVALGITCVQCTPVQLEILRRAGAMPVSSRRCGMITRREAERLCKSFLGDNAPPRLPDDFAFSVHHECAWGCRGAFLPSRYNSSRAKCIKCTLCGLFFSPNKFIFHSHRTGPGDKYVQPDAANFNSWRRHMKLSGNPPDEITHAWEDVKAMFNGGTRKRLMTSTPSVSSERNTSSVTPPKMQKTVSESANPVSEGINFSVTSPSPSLTAPIPRVPPFSDISLPLSRSLVMDYVWHQSQAAKQHHQFSFSPYTLPWLKRGSPLLFGHTASESPLLSFHRNAALGQESKPVFHQSAFRPVQAGALVGAGVDLRGVRELSDDETVDIETTEDEEMNIRAANDSPRAVWTSPSRIDGEQVPSGGTSERSPTPASTHSLTALHSTSPVSLKVEGDSSPPLSQAITASIRRTASYDEQIPASQNTNHDGSQPNHQYERSVFFRERQDVRGYHRDGTRRSPHHGYQRDTLWSVARLSLERQDRGADLYRQDVTAPRNFLEVRDKESDQSRNGSPGGPGPVSDCPSCSACRTLSQQAVSPGENNNKVPTP